MNFTLFSTFVLISAVINAQNFFWKNNILIRKAFESRDDQEKPASHLINGVFDTVTRQAIPLQQQAQPAVQESARSGNRIPEGKPRPSKGIQGQIRLFAGRIQDISRSSKMTFVSQVIGHEHITERETMDAARAQEKRIKAEREAQIASLRSRLDSAKRKLDEPHFSSDGARSLYRGMMDTVDALAQSYVRELHYATHSARKSGFRLESQEAIAYFNRDAIAAKLPALAEAAMARDPQRPPAIPADAGDRARGADQEEINFCRAELLKLGIDL